MKKFKSGEIYPMKLHGLAIGGEAVGILNDLVIFVPYGAPGDEIEVRLTEIKKNYARGEINRIIKKSPHRIEPKCPIFYKCGGCQLQHITYGAQLIYKRRMVEEVLHHLGGIREIRVEDVLEAPNPWNYRNKMQVVASSKPFLHSKRSSPFFGLYAKKTHQVIKMEECFIQHPLSNEVLKVAKEVVAKLRWDIYNEKTHRGMLRHLITRVSFSKNEVLLIIVTTTDKIPNLSEFVQMMTRKIPNIRGIVINKNDKKTNTILGPNFWCVWGDDYLIEEIAGIKYRISSQSFFQVNPPQVERMFEVLERFLEPSDKDLVLDAYCGVGAISLWLARKVRTVVGIEEVSQAKKDALDSASLNNIGNLDFHVGRVEKVLPQLYHRGHRIDKVVLDPPRKGCEASVLELLAKMRIKRIVYVSCNPATLARDLAILKKHNYRVERVIPIDMFPQTYHIESVARLTYEPSGIVKKAPVEITYESEKAKAALEEAHKETIPSPDEVKKIPPKKEKPKDQEETKPTEK